MRKRSGVVAWARVVFCLLAILVGVILAVESSVGTGRRALGLVLSVFGLAALVFWIATGSDDDS